MDKLKPILEQRFWILSGLAIILSVVGWFMSKGTLSAEIDKRRGELKTAFDSVKGSGANPNEKWTQQVNQQNDLLAKELRIAYEQLYERQKSLMFWPEGISEAAKLRDPAKVTSTDAFVYRARYPDHAEEVRATIEPYDEESATGKVKFPAERMVDIGLNIQKWQVQPPVAQEIFDAQEDLWLYQNLFTAIAAINRSATGPADATIRDVIEVVLRGGDPDRIGEASSGAQGGGAEGNSFLGGPPGDYTGGGGGPGGPKLSGGKVDFSPDDEFGPDADNSGGGSESPAAPGIEGGQFGAGAQAAAPKKRYIRETEQWKTRGFYLKMVIDHRKLPEVIAGLTAAPWPIRITRVHQVDLHPEDLFDAGSTGTPGFTGGPGTGGGFSPTATGSFGGGDAASPPQIGGASLLTAGTSARGGFGSSDGFAAPGTGSAGAAAPTYNPDSFVAGAGAPGFGAGATPVEGGDPFAAAMADPDLVVVTLDGWIVMYQAPPADPNAPAPSTETPAEPAAPAADLSSGSAAAPAAAAAPSESAPTAPAAEGAPSAPAKAGEPGAAPPSTEPTTPPAEGTPPAGTTEKPAAEPAVGSPASEPPAADKPAATKPATEKPATEGEPPKPTPE